MLTLVGLQKMQKREFSKESKGKPFFCLIFSTDFFFGVGESQSNLRDAKPPSMARYWLARTKVTLCHSELGSESQIRTQKRDAETSSA